MMAFVPVWAQEDKQDSSQMMNVTYSSKGIELQKKNKNTGIQENRQYETSLAFNWFFGGHKNKLTGELSHFGFQDESLPLQKGLRFRVQWDISL